MKWIGPANSFHPVVLQTCLRHGRPWHLSAGEARMNSRSLPFQSSCSRHISEFNRNSRYKRGTDILLYKYKKQRVNNHNRRQGGGCGQVSEVMVHWGIISLVDNTGWEWSRRERKTWVLCGIRKKGEHLVWPMRARGESMKGDENRWSVSRHNEGPWIKNREFGDSC